MPEAGFTAGEMQVLGALVLAWNSFLALPVEHSDDVREFRTIIHHAEAMMLMRPGRRHLNGEVANG